MIDLSNNNEGKIDFRRVWQAGQRRIAFKCTEGTDFVDKVTPGRVQAAKKQGFLVSLYHFADLNASPREELKFFLQHSHDLHAGGHNLRFALDLEKGTPSSQIGRWALEFMTEAKKELGYTGLIYSYASYLEGCHFQTAFAPLWLASYGRDDGKEYPYKVPTPWKRIAAHQFASKARVAGIEGYVDISHIYNFKVLEVPK